MKKFGFASLLLALSFAQLGCGEPETKTPEPSLPAATTPPAGGEAMPAEGEAAPAEGEAKPAEGDAAPAEGEAKPAEGDAKAPE